MSKKEIRIISLKFRTLASQMLRIDSDEEKNFIKMFYDFVCQTEILNGYIKKCNKETYNFDEIYSLKNWYSPLNLPSTEEELVDYLFQLIKYIVEEKRNFISICHGYTNSKKLKDIISSFMRKVIEPFVDILKNYLEICYVEQEDENISVNTNVKTVFLSYCQKDSDIADLVEEQLTPKISDQIKISRDIRDVEFHESFKKFMQSIEDHDYVIMVISDNYFKSRNCLFEVLEVVKDSKFDKKLMFMIISEEDKKYYKSDIKDSIAAKIYGIDGGIEYIHFWKEQEQKLSIAIETIGDPVASIQQIKELAIIRKIIIDLPSFLEFIKDRNGYSISKHMENNFGSILKFMKIE